MGLFDFVKKESDELNGLSFIKEMKHIRGPWQQYDFYLDARPYGWDYMVDSAQYMTGADLSSIGTVSVSAIAGAGEKECIDEYRQYGSVSKMPVLSHEMGALGIGGFSKAFEGAPVKIVWFNQTSFLRVFTPVDDEDKALRYAETLIRRSFGTKDAMKRGKTK